MNDETVRLGLELRALERFAELGVGVEDRVELVCGISGPREAFAAERLLENDVPVEVLELAIGCGLDLSNVAAALRGLADLTEDPEW